MSHIHHHRHHRHKHVVRQLEEQLAVANTTISSYVHHGLPPPTLSFFWGGGQGNAIFELGPHTTAMLYHCLMGGCAMFQVAVTC